MLAITDEAERLAPLLLKAVAMAPNAETDAAIDKQCRASGYDPPVICTPQELIER